MEMAVGTSLVVIAMNTAAGFVGVVGQVPIDAHVAVAVTLAAVAGSFIGGAQAGRISPAALKTGFGWFVIAMAFFILAQELPPLFGFERSIGVALAVSALGTLVLGLLARLFAKRHRPSQQRPGKPNLTHRQTSESPC
jgi:hypothetical protein